MKELNVLAVTVCVCCIACSVVSLIFPNGVMSKIINLVIGAFLICSMLLSIVGITSFFPFDTNIKESSFVFEEDSYASYEKTVLNNTAKNLVTVTNDFLISEDIIAEDIKVTIKKSDNNSIYISGIYIYITENYANEIEKIKKLILRNMSKEPVVIINEEKNRFK